MRFEKGLMEAKLMVYIPAQHEKYDLLPMCRSNGGEVFDYPGSLISEAERLVKPSESLLPYNYNSYEDYFTTLDRLIESLMDQPGKRELLMRVKRRVWEMNQKEEWSVLKYLGPSDEGGVGLTHGKIYYWPTRKSKPVYCGVIDNEEFTAYLYPTDEGLWQIIEDPTGMAHRTIFEKGKGHLTMEQYRAMLTRFGCVFSDTQE